MSTNGYNDCVIAKSYNEWRKKGPNTISYVDFKSGNLVSSTKSTHVCYFTNNPIECPICYKSFEDSEVSETDEMFQLD